MTPHPPAPPGRLRQPGTGLPTRPQLSALALVVAVADLAAHLAVAGHYGFFRDELYYLAAGQHLQLSYVDFPVLIALMAWGLERLGADSLVAIHVLPAVAGAALVIVTAAIARELGGGRVAQALAAIATAVSLTFLATASIFSMDAWDELWWTLMAYLLVRLAVRDTPRLWLALGLVAGVGLLTKLTVLYFVGALAVGVAAAPTRRWLGTRWPWLGAGIASLFLVPTLVWQAQHGWASLAYWHAYTATLVTPAPLAFALEQVYTMNPLTLPLWLIGLVVLVGDRGGRGLRPLGLAFCLLFLWFSVTPSKAYYLAPAYPVLLAAGAVAVAGAATARRRRWCVAYGSALVAAGCLLAPVAMPILPPAMYARAYGFLGTDGGAPLQRGDAAAMPQWLADRFGWSHLAEVVAGVDRRLPAAERRGACVFAANYGEAAAIDHFGPRLGLPPAISGSNSFYFWGPGHCRGGTVILVGLSREAARRAFRSVVPAAVSRCRACMPAEDGALVLVARRPRQPLRRLWPTTLALG